MPAPFLQLFAATAPGLERLAAAELAALGVVPGAVEAGGVSFEGAAEQLYAANLRLRTASRVVVRMGAFRARTFFELERHARRLPWERYVDPGRAVRVRVTCRKSRLYHSDAVAQRLLEAITHRVGALGGAAVAAAEGVGDVEDGVGAQLFVARFLHDECTVSADSSGALLHLRGYRQALAKAPLRETLAAALLLGSRWDGAAPLLDPMCGSGTIAIEGALLARRIAPGLLRAQGSGPGAAADGFAFARWPDFDAGRWASLVERAHAEVLPAAPGPILASDRDAGAITAAAANAERAGVAADVRLSVRPLSAVEPPESPGWLATNPPYGVRVGEGAPLRDLYARLGAVARQRCPGWTVALLSADRRLEGCVGLPFTEVLRTSNGGIPIRVVVAEVEGGC